MLLNDDLTIPLRSNKYQPFGFSNLEPHRDLFQLRPLTGWLPVGSSTLARSITWGAVLLRVPRQLDRVEGLVSTSGWKKKMVVVSGAGADCSHREGS